MGYDDIVRQLEAGKAGSGLACAEVRNLLTSLGFSVKDGSRGGHKTVTHDHLPDFSSTAYNCKGGSGVVDRNYIGVLLRVVRNNAAAIKEYLGEHEPDD